MRQNGSILTKPGARDMRTRSWIPCLSILLLLAAPPSLRPIVFYSTADPDYHTTPPGGDSADSGWQWQGRWGYFTGTPIASNLFLTAKHIGGTVGDPFLFQDVPYPAVASYPDAETDLVVWQVCGSFPTVAPLYDGPGEVGCDCVLLGRGSIRGAEVTCTNEAGPILKGWLWGSPDGRLRWGKNTITEIVDSQNGIGKLLVAAFDQDGLPDEACLAGGDSGSGLFIRNGDRWQLAGINYAVDGPFSYSSSGPAFHGALFDRGGLYQWAADNTWEWMDCSPAPKPSAIYATQVASRLVWLQAVIAAHQGRDPPPALWASSAVQGPYQPASDTTVDEAAQTIRIPMSGPAAFYRLSACQTVQIIGATTDGSQVVLRYQAFTPGSR